MRNGVSTFWVLAGNVVDSSGLRYEDAGSFFAEAQNTAVEMREIGIQPLNFSCIPAAKVKGLNLVIPVAPRSSFKRSFQLCRSKAEWN